MGELALPLQFKRHFAHPWPQVLAKEVPESVLARRSSVPRAGQSASEHSASNAAELPKFTGKETGAMHPAT